jgi:hypothetical protein
MQPIAQVSGKRKRAMAAYLNPIQTCPWIKLLPASEAIPNTIAPKAAKRIVPKKIRKIRAIRRPRLNADQGSARVNIRR